MDCVEVELVVVVDVVVLVLVVLVVLVVVELVVVEALVDRMDEVDDVEPEVEVENGVVDAVVVRTLDEVVAPVGVFEIAVEADGPLVAK